MCTVERDLHKTHEGRLIVGSIRKRPDRSRPYQARYRAPDGHERTRAFKRKVDAERWLLERERDKARGDWVDPALGQTLFSDWATKVEATRLNRRPSSRARDQSLLGSLILPAFGDRPLAGVDPMDIRRWVADLEQRGYAPATISKAYQIVSRAFRVAVTDGIITRSPCREVKLPKIETAERRFLSPGEVEELADAIEIRYRTLVLTGAYTGLRFGELAALRTDDFDPLRRTLRVDEQLSRQGTGRMVSSPLKTRKARRTIGIPQFLSDELVDQITTHPSASDLIFSMTRRGPLDYIRFRSRYWYPAVDASVGRPCTPHDLRHTHVAILIAQGESPKYIADRLGHESTRTVFDVYGHLYDGVDEAATDRLEEVRMASRADQARSKRGPEVIELSDRKPKPLAT
ncbi:tyrosine-type recombinase/integrase [Actinomycetota bacterium]